MAKLVEYVCPDKTCLGTRIEDIFGDTEDKPEVHPEVLCEHCGKPLVKGYNVKSNSQVWKNV